MKEKGVDARALDLRDRVDASEKADAILLQRVRVILLQRLKRKRKLQPP